VWTPEAFADLRRLVDFLKRKDALAAGRAAKAIRDGPAMLSRVPLAGKIMDDGARREWFVRFGASSYVLRYRIDADGRVVVIRIWHSREDRPPA
jgi:toxin ParE1/3/4